MIYVHVHGIGNNELSVCVAEHLQLLFVMLYQQLVLIVTVKILYVKV